MRIKTVIKNYWVLILLSCTGIYSFVEYGDFAHLVFSITTIVLLLLVSLSKNERKTRIVIGTYLLLLVIWQITDMVINGEPSVFKIMFSVSFSIISTILITNKNQKITALKGNNFVQSIVMLILCSFVYYQFIQSEPYDLLEIISIIITGTFSIILSWFLFQDLMTEN